MLENVTRDHKQDHHHNECREGHLAEVNVKVSYVGCDEYFEKIPITIHSLKLKVMKHFNLDPAAADQYVLQLHGADLCDEDRKIEDLNLPCVDLVLHRKKEIVKG